MTEKSSNKELKRRVQELETDCLHLEKKLHDAKSLTEEIMTYMSEGLVLTDTRGIVIFINQRLSEMLGYLSEEIIGNCWLDMVPVEQHAIAKEAEARRAQGHTDQYEIILRHKDGRNFPVLIGAGPRFNKQSGEFIGTMGIVTDITKRRRAEVALRESEEKFRHLFEFSSDAHVLFDGEKYLDCNDACIKMLGLAKREDLLSLHPKDISPQYQPDGRSSAEAAQAMIDIAMHTGTHSFEWVCRNKNGSLFFIDARLNRVHLQGKPVIHSVWRDITERKQAEKALIESEALFRGMFKDHSAVMLLVDPNTGQIVEANQSAAQYYGYPLENMIQMKIQQLNLLSPAEIMEKMGDAFNKQVNIFEFRHVLADGQIRDVEVHSTPIAIQNQTLLFSIIHDITKRKKSQKALRESERFLRSTVDGLTAHITVLDERGDIILTNEAYRNFAEQNGIEPHTVSEGANYLAVCDTASGEHSDEAVPFAKGIRDVLSGERRSFQLEYPCHSPGEKRWFVGHVTSFLGEGPRRVIIAHENITERKQAEVENEKLQEQLSQIKKSESLGRMAGSIAHHFNNQLSVMMGNLELVLDDLPDNAENRENLSQAFKAGHKAAEVSQQMLRYLGHISGNQTTINLADVCRQSLALLQSAFPSGLTLNVDFPDSGPFVHADAGQIQQVLTNLFTNAQESVPENQGIIGLIIQTVSHKDISTSNRFPLDWHPQDNPYACLEISDTGCGMSKENIVKIFDPFYTTKFTGRGMGLPVTMGILKTHDGCITVDSEPESGTVFRVYLPVTTEKKTVKHEKVTKPKENVGNGVTVLLIEDETSVRNTAKIMISRMGYAVIEVQEGVGP